MLRSGGRVGQPLPAVDAELDYPSLLNRSLPEDIRVLGWTDVPADFSARSALPLCCIAIQLLLLPQMLRRFGCMLGKDLRLPGQAVLVCLMQLPNGLSCLMLFLSDKQVFSQLPGVQIPHRAPALAAAAAAAAAATAAAGFSAHQWQRRRRGGAAAIGAAAAAPAESAAAAAAAAGAAGQAGAAAAGAAGQAGTTAAAPAGPHAGAGGSGCGAHAGGGFFLPGGPRLQKLLQGARLVWRGDVVLFVAVVACAAEGGRQASVCTRLSLCLLHLFSSTCQHKSPVRLLQLASLPPWPAQPSHHIPRTAALTCPALTCPALT